MSKLPPNPYADTREPTPLRPMEHEQPHDGGLTHAQWLYLVALVSCPFAAGAVWSVTVLRNDQTWPLLLAGIVVGGALRLLTRPQPHTTLVAAVSTILACASGFVLGDLWLPWQPPSTLLVALDKMLSLQFIVLTSVAVSAAHWIATLGRET